MTRNPGDPIRSSGFSLYYSLSLVKHGLVCRLPPGGLHLVGHDIAVLGWIRDGDSREGMHGDGTESAVAPAQGRIDVRRVTVVRYEPTDGFGEFRRRSSSAECLHIVSEVEEGRLRISIELLQASEVSRVESMAGVEPLHQLGHLLYFRALDGRESSVGVWLHDIVLVESLADLLVVRSRRSKVFPHSDK